MGGSISTHRKTGLPYCPTGTAAQSYLCRCVRGAPLQAPGTAPPLPGAAEAQAGRESPDASRPTAEPQHSPKVTSTSTRRRRGLRSLAGGEGPINGARRPYLDPRSGYLAAMELTCAEAALMQDPRMRETPRHGTASSRSSRFRADARHRPRIGISSRPASAAPRFGSRCSETPQASAAFRIRRLAQTSGEKT